MLTINQSNKKRQKEEHKPPQTEDFCWERQVQIFLCRTKTRISLVALRWAHMHHQNCAERH